MAISQNESLVTFQTVLMCAAGITLIFWPKDWLCFANIEAILFHEDSIFIKLQPFHCYSAIYSIMPLLFRNVFPYVIIVRINILVKMFKCCEVDILNQIIFSSVIRYIHEFLYYHILQFQIGIFHFVKSQGINMRY